MYQFLLIFQKCRVFLHPNHPASNPRYTRGFRSGEKMYGTDSLEKFPVAFRAKVNVERSQKRGNFLIECSILYSLSTNRIRIQKKKRAYCTFLSLNLARSQTLSVLSSLTVIHSYCVGWVSRPQTSPSPWPWVKMGHPGLFNLQMGANMQYVNKNNNMELGILMSGQCWRNIKLRLGLISSSKE